MEGHQRSNRVAFSCHRVMARRPKRCLVTSVGSEGCDLCPRKSPILLIVPMSSYCPYGLWSPTPRASTTMGAHSTPAVRHEGRLAESLRLTHTSRA